MFKEQISHVVKHLDTHHVLCDTVYGIIHLHEGSIHNAAMKERIIVALLFFIFFKL